MNQVKEEIPRCGRINPKTRDKHNFCYQFSIYGTDLIFVNLNIIDKRCKPFLPVKTSTIHEKFYMRAIFIKNTGKNNYEEMQFYDSYRHKLQHIKETVCNSSSN